MKKDIFSCKGKIAVVTGGSGLLGSKICESLTDAGARVYAADTKNARKARFIEMDITQPACVQEVFDKVISREKRIDILVNAAYPRTNDWNNKIDAVSFDSWVKNVNAQLGGYFLTSRRAAQQMKKQKTGGSIINLASIYGIVAPDFSVYSGTDKTMPAAYAAIKSGVIGMTRYIATYYARYNVRANIVSPGGVFDRQSSSFVKKYCAKVPLGRMADAQDVAAAVVYLASNASSYVTGHNLVVDGGWSTW